MILGHVLRQHVDETASLFERRLALTAATRIALRDLRRMDERIAAHLDGVFTAGREGGQKSIHGADLLSAGGVFVAAVCSIVGRDLALLNELLAASHAGPSVVGLIGAFGWVERAQLQGVVASLMSSESPASRMIAIAACAMHRVDPGLLSARGILDRDPQVRARALRTAGEIGSQDAASACTAALKDPDPECVFWAAWSSVLLGNRGPALEVLVGTGITPGVHQARAFRLVLQAMSARAGHELLRQLAKDPGQLRQLIQGSGIAGDSVYVPWLIKHMTDAKTARLAGEAFTLITGADLSQGSLETTQPAGFESGPNDDPDDPNVDLDPDEGLAWPDPVKVEAWWVANASRFPAGTRYFMGGPLTREHCIDVLKNGYQRQRILAAHYLCLLEPGSQLFNTGAPAWRQERWLLSIE